MENQYVQFKQKFVEEATRLSNDLERDLLLLENKPDDKELIESVFRCMHTLKGVSSMYGFDNIANVTHHLENIYDLIRNHELEVSSPLIQTTLVSADFIRSLLNDNDSLSEANKIINQKIFNSIQQIIDGAGIQKIKEPVKKRIKKSDNAFATWQITFIPEEAIITRCINLVYTFKDLFALGTYKIVQNEPFQERTKFTVFLFTDKTYDNIEDALLFIMDYCKVTKIADYDIFDNEALEQHLHIEPEAYKKKWVQDQSSDTPVEVSVPFVKETIETGEIKNTQILNTRIGVETSKLDELMYLVSELITTNSQLNMASHNTVYQPLLPLFEKIDKLSKQFRHNTLNLRLVPINEMTIRFQRLVRDLSVKLGKEIELVTQGTETELDKSTIDTLVDPLMHIIRNCIDHGIETPEIRQQNNKPPKGIVKITAYHSVSFIFIQIQDDGKGIDTELIREKAIQKGIITPDKQLTEKEIYDLIFLPGFSTAESLTQVSGRGVGMDVVKKKITELRGQIEISSEIGLGTSFTIKLHQTIAILDTMLFQINEMHFMVPLSDVEECRLADIKEIELRKHTQTLEYQNRLIPYFNLYDHFGLSPDQSLRKLKILIIRRQDICFALAADRIIGEHQAVLKSIGDVAKKQEYISVASVLGDGNLAYLLDLNVIHSSLTKNILQNEKV
ncbi:MAG: chemotaxis protein CheA [Bacteroidales bacterium]|nr:chemotaxis protein CheA [Bacteroidales bacterium]